MFPKNFENIVKSNLSKNLPKILPKSFQNPFKILPKSTKIAPKSCPKSILDPKRVPKPSWTRFFRFFIDFLSLRDLPKSSPNHKKSKKNDEKLSVFWDIDFGRIPCAMHRPPHRRWSAKSAGEWQSVVTAQIKAWCNNSQVVWKWTPKHGPQGLQNPARHTPETL